MAEASGRALLGLIRFVKDRAGDEGLARIVKDAGPAAETAFRQRVRQNDWIPYATFVSFLRSIDKNMSDGNPKFCRELGAAGGKRDLGTFLRVFVALASAERLIRSCSRVWPSYYRGAGRMEAIAWAPTNTLLCIYDFPTMDPLHCRLMEGWMISTMESLGFRVSDDARETKCTQKGAPHHEFACTWKPIRG